MSPKNRLLPVIWSNIALAEVLVWYYDQIYDGGLPPSAIREAEEAWAWVVHKVKHPRDVAQAVQRLVDKETGRQNPLSPEPIVPGPPIQLELFPAVTVDEAILRAMFAERGLDVEVWTSGDACEIHVFTQGDARGCAYVMGFNPKFFSPSRVAELLAVCEEIAR